MSHDNSYKLLFSHPEMVTDLLKGFVKEAWIEQCDFSTLEKVSGSYVADDLRDREDDLIWKIRWGDEWLYVYLRKYSVPLFEKEGLGEILLDKSPSIPLFQRGR